MKIPEFKRFGIGIIAEFRGIPSGFPNQAQDSQFLPPNQTGGMRPHFGKETEERGGNLHGQNMNPWFFDFDGTNKTIWLEEGRRAALLTILHLMDMGSKNMRTGDTIC